MQYRKIIAERFTYHFVIAVWRAKRHNRRTVTLRKTIIAFLATLSTSLASAEDFKTVTGKEYKNATVSRVEPDGIVVKSKSGITKIYFSELPKEVQERFHYDSAQAGQFNAAQQAIAGDLRQQLLSAGGPLTGLFTVVLLRGRYEANAGDLFVELLDYRLER